MQIVFHQLIYLIYQVYLLKALKALFTFYEADNLLQDVGIGFSSLEQLHCFDQCQPEPSYGNCS